MSLDDIHHQAEIGLRDELGLLGFDLSGGVLGNILFPHHVGHYVGIDLHDVGSFGRVQKLKQGHVVTIEP
jgi:intermediate cleaving peptidase 55